MPGKPKMRNHFAEKRDDASQGSVIGREARRGLKLRYMKLEQRRVLNADFSIAGGVFNLENFSETGGEDVFVTDNGASVLFQLQEGDWSGTPSGTDVTFTNGDLTITKAFLTNAGINSLNLNADGFSDLNVFLTNNLDLSAWNGTITFNHEGTFSGGNLTATSLSVDSGSISGNAFSTTTGALSLTAANDVDVAGASISTGTDATSDLTINASGSVTVSGTISNSTADADADIEIIATGTNSDIIVNSDISSAAGDIRLTADDSIIVGSTSTLSASGTSEITIIASNDALDGDGGDQIDMGDGALIDGGSGNVTISALGTATDNIDLARVTTTGDVAINASGNLTDATASNAVANVQANELVLTVGPQDASGDGNITSFIDVNNVSFSADGAVNLTDLGLVNSGLTINLTSVARGGGSIVANSPLTISANILTNTTMSFTASNDPFLEDDLTIDSGAVVTLDANTDEILTFTAGDDVIFNTGRIEVDGTGAHTVNLVADDEGASDADRGSVTNTGGAAVSVAAINAATLRLNITAFDGIGDSSGDGGTTAAEAFRFDADTIFAQNTGANEIRLSEVDSIAIDSVDNSTRDVNVVAANEITDGGDANTDIVAGTATLVGGTGVGGANQLETTISNLDLDSGTGDAGINQTGDLIIDALDIDGAFDLDVVGSVVDTATTTILVVGNSNLLASDEICLIDGANNFGAAVTASGDTVEIVDINNLVVDTVSAVDDIFLRAGETALGSLTIQTSLATSDPNGQILLQADSGVAASTATITTSELLLGGDDADEGSGNFDLSGTNNVGSIASDVDGEVDFNNGANALIVASLSYASFCGTNEPIVGMDVDTKIRLAGAGITLNEDVSSTLVFLESNAGVTQGGGAISATNLMLQGTGDFILNDPTNEVTNLAADITGSMTYFDATGVTLNELTCDATTINGVSVSVNVILDVTSLDQTADAPMIVGGTTSIDANGGDICLTFGDIDGDLDNDNDFTGTVTIVSSDAVEIVDINDLVMGSVAAESDARFQAGDGAATGNLDLTGSITLSGAAPTQVLLQADDGVDQTDLTQITATQLFLQGAGDFNLNTSTFNQVSQLAADIDGSLTLLNGLALDIADLTGANQYTSDCGTTLEICGVNIDQNGGAGGNLTITLNNVDLTQSASVAAEGTASLDVGTGTICLTGADCTGDGLNDNDFVGEVTAVGDTVEIVDRDALVINTITAVDDVYLRSGSNGTGALTINGDITVSDAASQVLLQSDSGVTQALTSTIEANDLLLGGNDADEGSGSFNLLGTNNVNNIAADVDGEVDFDNDTNALIVASLSYASVCGTNEPIVGMNVDTKIRLAGAGITLNEDVSSTLVFLESSAGVTQGGGAIAATNLMLQGTGDFILNDPTNEVTNLAADITGSMNYFDATGVTLGELVCDATTISGVSVSVNVILDVTSLDQSADAPMIVGGTTSIDANGGDICLTFGDIDGDLDNDNDFTGTVTIVSSDAVEIVDINDLIMGSVAAESDARFQAGDGAATGNLDLTGNITLSGAVPTQVLLQADDGVDQTDLTQITATQLFLQGAGDFNLNTSTFNQVSQLAADIDGNLTILNGLTLDIADLTGANQYTSDCGTTLEICGVNIDQNGGAGGNLTITLNNVDLTQSAAVTVEGDTTIDSGSGNICLTGGDCTGDGINDNLFAET